MSFFGPFFGLFCGATPGTPSEGSWGDCTGPTLAQAQAALAQRLNDPLFVRWPASECTGYLVEALRTWQVWTSWQHGTVAIGLPLATPFLDLPASAPALRPSTVTNWQIVAAIQAALLEPVAPGGTWTGTAQFTLAQLTDEINNRADAFRRETGIVQTRVQLPVAASLSGRVALSNCWLQIRRAAWRDLTTGYLFPLRRADDWAAATYSTTWTTPGAPSAYGISGTPPSVLQIFPPPANPGVLDLLVVEAGPALSPTTETVLGIPDDYAWVVKYGALADLLSHDGLALDMARSQYAEQRWSQGVELARRQAVVLAAQITRGSGTPATCRVGSVADADAYAPSWQMVASIPRTVLLAGQTVLGVWPPAGGTATYTLTLDLVRAAEVPTLATDRLVIPPDVFDTILDLAQVAALFKEGPGQVELALPILERAAGAAGVDLSLQQATVPARLPLHSQQQQDTSTSPRRLPALPVEVV